MSGLTARRQLSVLTERYLMCTLGEAGTTLFLLAQAPLIGWLCTLVWGSVETDTPSLWFVLCLTSIWFGCIGACREVVKERAIVERERSFGLSLRAYLGSRYIVQAGMTLVQVTTLLLTVQLAFDLSGPLVLQWLALWLAALCGTGLGLLVSALSSHGATAVGAVPLLLLPQVLFSEIALPPRALGSVVRNLQQIMPVHWAFELFKQAASPETAWLQVAWALLVLVGINVALAIATGLALVPRRDL